MSAFRTVWSRPTTPELADAALWIIPTHDAWQVIADEVVEALSHRRCLFAGSVHKLILNGKSDVHEHNIRAHV